jgi:tRNA-dihydrouridine synthase
MGCPVKDVTSKGTCSALIKNPTLAKEMIQATKEGAGDMPVSVKTRLGYYTIQTEEWTGFLLEQGLDALTVHCRTVREMSKVPAHWDELSKVVALRDKMGLQTVIMGNGDVKSIADGKEKALASGADGIMVGRGVFENAWVFREDIDPVTIPLAERMKVLLRHVDLYEQKEGERLAFHTLKKYFKIYVRDFDGASELRAKLMESNEVSQVRQIIAAMPSFA